ncbi:hypothetical protein L3X38_022624 [Prunus dulcis]|uniref:Transposable element protein n=1 Tax=Prunus dulcis TaxID=3755 RepID=A0AAD4VWB4_PRUDU|nr:hypothetical protein L3X38_022624 [Prunus dulcis]
MQRVLSLGITLVWLLRDLDKKRVSTMVKPLALSIVGALQYLTFTRPNFAFSVNQACQFMHNPMESHVVAVKRILRYLKGTIDFRIHFQPGPLNLQAYSDANRARNPHDRRFVSGFIVYLGSSPIS